MIVILRHLEFKATVPLDSIVTATTRCSVRSCCEPKRATFFHQLRARSASVSVTPNGPTQVAFVVSTFCTGITAVVTSLPDARRTGGGAGIFLLGSHWEVDC